MKIILKKFSDFNFGMKIKNGNWSDDVTKMTITQEIKNRKISFSFYSADFRSSMKKKIEILKNFKKKKIAAFFCSYIVSACSAARFACGSIEDPSFNRFALNSIPELPATLFFGIA